VFASHVLEHIPDDGLAIREIRRILVPDGIAILPVPLVSLKTIEYAEPNPLKRDTYGRLDLITSTDTSHIFPGSRRTHQTRSQRNTSCTSMKTGESGRMPNVPCAKRWRAKGTST
jgi:hypothetical protein